MENHISIYHIILLYKISYYGQSPACLVPKWSDFWSHKWLQIDQIDSIWSDIGPIFSELVPYGRIWSQKWSTKIKKHIFPEMSQN